MRRLSDRRRDFLPSRRVSKQHSSGEGENYVISAGKAIAMGHLLSRNALAVIGYGKIAKHAAWPTVLLARPHSSTRLQGGRRALMAEE
jgi:hypothetical protein